jgi:hypothetical protein
MKKIILSFLLIVSLLLVSCGAGDQAPDIPAGMTEESGEFAQYNACVEQCGTCEQSCLDQVYYDMAVVESSSDVCDRIASVGLQETCKEELVALEALAGNNPGACAAIVNEGLQQLCYKRVYAAQAFVTRDISVCDSLEDPVDCQDMYYVDVALSTNDVSLCDMVDEVENCVERVESMNVDAEEVLIG